jgi:hypothetical protein
MCSRWSKASETSRQTWPIESSKAKSTFNNRTLLSRMSMSDTNPYPPSTPSYDASCLSQYCTALLYHALLPPSPLSTRSHKSSGLTSFNSHLTSFRGKSFVAFQLIVARTRSTSADHLEKTSFWHNDERQIICSMYKVPCHSHLVPRTA